MTSLIGRTRDRIRALFAPSGRHRAVSSIHLTRPVRPVGPPSRPGPYATDTPIDGRATAMVRPYLLTCEQRQEQRRRLHTFRVPAYGMREMEVAR